MDQLLAMRTFVKVVEQGSFVGASRDMDIDQARVTRRIADLEAHLGARLLARTTRSLRLTEAGEDYLARCRRIIDEVDAAAAQVRQGQELVAGRVKLAVPLAFGLDLIGPRLKEFKEKWPQVVLDISLLDHPVDVVAEGYDIAITTTISGLSSSVVSRPLFDAAFGLFAAPTYLQAAGVPGKPDQLGRHAAISHSHDAVRNHWKLTNARGQSMVVPINVVLWSNSFPLIRQAVCDGLGIGMLSRRLVARELAERRLREVLPRWHLGGLTFTLIYPRRDFIPARVRALIDFILDERIRMTVPRQ